MNQKLCLYGPVICILIFNWINTVYSLLPFYNHIVLSFGPLIEMIIKQILNHLVFTDLMRLFYDFL